MTITSPHNDQLKEIRKLAGRKWRDKLRQFVAEAMSLSIAGGTMGVLLGIACWFRVNPLYLCVGWAFALLVLIRGTWQLKLKMSAAALLATVVVISPIVIRNYLVFPDFTPTGGTIGVNLWEGLGETDLGAGQALGRRGDDHQLRLLPARPGRHRRHGYP